jgi:AcrR family transcriptional regulator
MLKKTFADSAKGETKKARTRARLMDAATLVIAAKGLDAASVQEIAQQADVANGTFYSHFRDKEEIVAAVVHGIASAIAKQMDEGSPQLKDAAYRVAYATQKFIEISVNEPQWGWVFVHTFYHRAAHNSARKRHIEADVKLGIEQGRFDAHPNEFLFDALAAITKMAILSQLEKRNGKEAGRLAAECMLRLLGVTPANAKRICSEAVPPGPAKKPKRA